MQSSLEVVAIALLAICNVVKHIRWDLSNNF